MLIRANRSGAGLAAYAGEARVMQFVVGYIEHANVIPNLSRAPVSEGVYLDKLVLRAREATVELNDRHVGPAGALIAALAGNPGIDRG